MARLTESVVEEASDILFPKLISGEPRLKDVEWLVEQKFGLSTVPKRVTT